MVEVRAFRGIYYDPTRVEVEKVVTEPWDRITPEIQERYYSSDPFNIVRIIRGKDMPGDNERENKFTRAAETFRKWLKEGILVRDDVDAIYLYTQRFRLRESDFIRRGFLAAVKLEDYESKVILPHEHTFPSHNADRLHLLRETRANFGKIFMLYPDLEMKIPRFLARYDSVEPMISVRVNGVEHSIRRMTSPQDIEFIVEEMRGRQLFIADGHHRYHTALAYRNEMLPKLSEVGRREVSYRMMALVSLDDPSVSILPTHRAVRGIAGFSEGGILEELAAFFEVERLQHAGGDLQPMLDRLRESSTLAISFLICLRGGKFALIRLKDKASAMERLPGDPHPAVRELDITVLHSLIMERMLWLSPEAQDSGEYIEYFRDPAEAVGMVEKGEAQIAFLLNPTKVEQVRDVSLAGQVMPHKSTDFYPKLLTGLIMRKLEI
jgi:uncharacterized protein (DUF1015 family)